MNKLALCFFACSAATLPAAAESACSSSEHRQFDFWIGRWDVFDAKTGERAGSSLIESLYDGCVLRENWTSPGFAGGSLNIYVASDSKWHQTWVDQSGALREFIGGMENGKMILVAKSRIRQEPGKTVLVRMTFTPNPDGSVRQFSDYSKDEGATWAFRYDFVYKRTAQ